MFILPIKLNFASSFNLKVSLGIFLILKCLFLSPLMVHGSCSIFLRLKRFFMECVDKCFCRGIWMHSGADVPLQVVDDNGGLQKSFLKAAVVLVRGFSFNNIPPLSKNL